MNVLCVRSRFRVNFLFIWGREFGGTEGGEGGGVGQGKKFIFVLFQSHHIFSSLFSFLFILYLFLHHFLSFRHILLFIFSSFLLFFFFMLLPFQLFFCKQQASHSCSTIFIFFELYYIEVRVLLSESCRDVAVNYNYYPRTH